MMRIFAPKQKSGLQTMSTSSKALGQRSFTHTHAVSSILNLRRTLGNQAVLHSLRSNSGDITTSLAMALSSRFAHDFNGISGYDGARSETYPNMKSNAPILTTHTANDLAGPDGNQNNVREWLLSKPLADVQVHAIHPTTPRIQRSPDDPIPRTRNLVASLTTEELNRIARWIENYRIGIEPLTGDRGHDFDMIARAILCDRLLDAGELESEDPLLCVDDRVTESDPRFALIRQQIDNVFLPLPDATRPLSLDRQTDLVLFAMNLFIEGGPDLHRVGRRALDAVAQVVLNRIACGAPPYGASARDVIVQPAQFSWTNPGNPFFENAFFPLRLRDGLQKWLLCLAVAQQALSGGLTNPGIGQATHYFNPHAVMPPFAAAYPFVVQIGNHRFHQGPCPGGGP